MASALWCPSTLLACYAPAPPSAVVEQWRITWPAHLASPRESSRNPCVAGLVLAAVSPASWGVELLTVLQWSVDPDQSFARSVSAWCGMYSVLRQVQVCGTPRVDGQAAVLPVHGVQRVGGVSSCADCHPARRRPLQCCVGAALLQCTALADVQRGLDGVPPQSCSTTSKLVVLHSLICIRITCQPLEWC